MAGSSQSTAGPNYVLNTVVADVLSEIADELENAEDVNKKAQEILRNISIEHRDIIFNGDNYSGEWIKEAKRRGLPNIPSSVESFKEMLNPEVAELYERHGVLTRDELRARYEILLERYCKTIRIEAVTAISMAKRQILPAMMEYSGKLASTVNACESAGVCCTAHKDTLIQICSLINSLKSKITLLEEALEKTVNLENLDKQGEAYRDLVIPAMNAMRADADQLETIVDAKYWPLPTYAEMLFWK